MQHKQQHNKGKKLDIIKEQLLGLLIEIEDEEDLVLNEVVRNTKEPEEAIEIIN